MNYSDYYLSFAADIGKSAFYGLLAALPLIIAYHILTLNKRGGNKSVPHIIAAYIFCYIISFIFSATEIPDIFTFAVPRHRFFLNLTPFTYGDRTENVLNVVLFIPFGFFAPMLWRRFRNIFRLFFLGLLFSLFIEISQIFCHRVTDIDDFLLNAAGALIGWLLFMVIKLIIPPLGRVFCEGRENSAFGKSEIYNYIVFVFLASFFIKPFILRFLGWHGYV